MFAELYLVIFYHDFQNSSVKIINQNISNTYEIGLLLFTEHVFSFEVTAFILLVAIQLVIGGLVDLEILSINEQFKKYF